MPYVTGGSRGSVSYRNEVLGAVQQRKFEWDLRLRSPWTVYHRAHHGGFTSTGLIDGVGQADFDGNGTFTQHDYIVMNSTLVPGAMVDEDGFHSGETGTYTVNPDCTGNAVITLGPGNTRSLELVLADNGRTVHSIVSSAMVNGAPATIQVYSNFQKLESRR